MRRRLFHQQAVLRFIHSTLTESGKPGTPKLYLQRYHSGQLEKTLPKLSLFQKARSLSETDKIAVVHTEDGKQFTHGDLLADVYDFSEILKTKYRQVAGSSFEELKEARVAFLCESGYYYVVAQWAIWAAGGISVPICTSHPLPEMAYTVTDSQSSILLSTPNYYETIKQVASTAEMDLSHIINLSELQGSQGRALPELANDAISAPERKAMIIYTSGTTGRPKGVISLHKTITAQCKSLVEAWEYSSHDRILHTLPLHHIHGIINALNVPLYVGATVEFLPKFDAKVVWDRFLASSNDDSPALSLFMAVPTIYSKLIQYADKHFTSKEARERAFKACQQFRLMVSGSAALPSPTKSKWLDISGQVLLERYGMTETGMVLTCPYKDVEGRYDGSVGWPMPGAEVRLFSGGEDISNESNVEGEIQVKGDNVFAAYWNRPQEITSKEFHEGWFCTGDIALRDHEKHGGAYFIRGRASVDIIKSGGYKISALDVERQILSLPQISEVAVVGVSDEEWGQRVAAIVVLAPDVDGLSLEELRAQLKKTMPPYRVPTILRILESMPRNAMGKINKKALVKDIFGEKV